MVLEIEKLIGDRLLDKVSFLAGTSTGGRFALGPEGAFFRF